MYLMKSWSTEVSFETSTLLESELLFGPSAETMGLLDPEVEAAVCSVVSSGLSLRKFQISMLHYRICYWSSLREAQNLVTLGCNIWV